ncbi:hypothetical protein KP509_1Z103300 [Ceratopteris richardii]|nr:hypothetical protein KP509_1Z103300 [Ceratopteris richardii]
MKHSSMLLNFMTCSRALTSLCWLSFMRLHTSYHHLLHMFRMRAPILGQGCLSVLHNGSCCQC